MKKILCVLSLVLIAGVANAKDVKQSKRTTNNQLMSDSYVVEEIKITKQDIFRQQVKVFDMLDSNNDNKLTKEEFIAKGVDVKVAGDFISRVGDGKAYVPKIDVLYYLSKEFDIYDLNKDGFLTPDELLSALIKEARQDHGISFNKDEFKNDNMEMRHHHYYHHHRFQKHCE